MAWPANTTNIVTTNLDAAGDSPASARADLKAALDEIKNIISGRGEANGVAPLDASSKLAASYLVTTGHQIEQITPASNRHNIEDVVNLNPLTLAQLGTAIPSPQEGDVAYTTNGNEGAKCLVAYDGSNWKVVALGDTAATS